MSREPNAGRAQITLEVNRVICPRHGEVFRAKWPLGYTYFSVAAIHALLMREDFAAEWGRIQKENEGMTDQKAIEKALDGFPVCCRLGQRDLIDLYTDCKVGTVNKCVGCGNMALGTPFIGKHPHTKQHIHYKHVCFNCVINRMRES